MGDVGDSEEWTKVVVGGGCGGKARTKYEKGRFPDNERDVCPGEVVMELGRSGTNSRLSGMVYKIDKQRSGMETHLDTRRPSKRLPSQRSMGHNRPE